MGVVKASRPCGTTAEKRSKAETRSPRAIRSAHVFKRARLISPNRWLILASDDCGADAGDLEIDKQGQEKDAGGWKSCFEADGQASGRGFRRRYIVKSKKGNRAWCLSINGAQSLPWLTPAFTAITGFTGLIVPLFPLALLPRCHRPVLGQLDGGGALILLMD